jgi:carbonic anhydrase
MAVAVNFREFRPVDSRGDLMRRVENAPIEHAEAILPAYELLRQLHEKGMLELFSALLSAGETVVNHVPTNIKTHLAVAAALVEKRLTLHGWVYDIEQGFIDALDAETGRFVSLTTLPRTSSQSFQYSAANA